MLPVKETLRNDRAGKFLWELVVRAGGAERLAGEIGCSRVGLHNLMTTAGRVPYARLISALAAASGRSQEEVRALFGPRTDHRTKRAIVDVRARFPGDRLRLLIANRVEDSGSISVYALKLGVDPERLRQWLIGENRNLGEDALRQIAVHENLSLREVGIPGRTANDSRRATMLHHQRKWRRGDVHSEHMKRALASSVRARWADSSWRAQTGARTISAMQDGRRRLFRHDGRYVDLLLSRETGHFRRFHPGGHEPHHALGIACRVLRMHRERFPMASGGLPEMANRIHRALRLRGRPLDVDQICKFLEVFDHRPKPRPFWPAAAKYIYGNAGMAEQARKRWAEIRREVPQHTLLRIAEVTVGRAIIATDFEALIALPPGRPAG